MPVLTNRLTEQEVRKRLAVCKQTEVIDEVYTFGQMLLNEAITNFRGLDTKAGSLAAYGAAIVTLLVSSSKTWLGLGNRWTAVFGLLAGLTAFLATFFSVRAMALREVEWLSEREWLEESCFSAIEKLKRYRILTIWGAMSSRKNANLYKVKRLKYSQVCLLGSVFLLLLVLLQIAWHLGFGESFRVTNWKII